MRHSLLHGVGALVGQLPLGLLSEGECGTVTPPHTIVAHVMYIPLLTCTVPQHVYLSTCWLK